MRMNLGLLFATLFLVIALGFLPAAFAEEIEVQAPVVEVVEAEVVAESEAPAVPVNLSPAAQETTVHGGVLVVITYFVLFLLVAAFLVQIFRRQRSLQRDIDALDERLDVLLSVEGRG